MIKSKRIGEILINLGIITPEQLNAALLHQEKMVPRRKLGELLVELRMINEIDLLRCLSSLFRVRFITLDKLAGMDIPSWVINLIPADFAHHYSVLPFFCYDKTKILSVLVSDPQNRQLSTLMQKISGYDTETYLGLECTIKAGISKYYQNDLSAFERIKKQMSAAPPPAIASFISRCHEVVDLRHTEPPHLALQQYLSPHVVSAGDTGKRGTGEVREEEQGKRLCDQTSSYSLMSEDAMIELFNVVISILEMYKGESSRGHSARVAKLVKMISQAYGLPARDTYYHVLAAYLHDCCLHAPEHLTLLHYQSKDHLKLLEKYSQANCRLFERVRLPPNVGNILFHTFERFDGEGFPGRLKGEDIPLGSRIIAAVDAFMHSKDFDQKTNADNPYQAALETVKSHCHRLFDPQIIEHLENALANHLVNETSPYVLIIGSEFRDIRDVAEKLKKIGISTHRSCDTEEAKHFIITAPVPVVISEVDTHPTDGFAFCSFIKTLFPDIRFIFLSDQHDPAVIDKIFEAGADDFISKPFKPDALVEKVEHFIKNSSRTAGEPTAASSSAPSPQKRGVTGNLAEIRVTDLIQMLSTGRKTGRLKLYKEEESGEISFDQGEIISASYNKLQAVEAFNYLVRWEHGIFILDPDDELPQQVIFESTEHLILEAYRRWDEETMKE